jgi:hypothetical protein
VPVRIFWGAVLGGAAGAGLGRVLDGRVQVEAIIFVAIIGVIVALVMGAFRRTRAAVS